MDIHDSEGVWLDKSFAENRNLKVGDEITFEANGSKIKKIIKGLGYSPEYIYFAHMTSTLPDHYSFGYAYMSHKAFPSDKIPYNVLNVKFDGTSDTYSKLVDSRLKGYYTAFLARSNSPQVDAVLESINQQKSLSSLFPSIFIIVSMLMLLTTTKRIISHQRTQIGILKANGFKNNTIAWHYLLAGFITVILGAVLGTLLGPIIFHMLANPSRTFYYKLPYWHTIELYKYAIIIPLLGVISLFVSNYSIKNIVNEDTSIIMKAEAPKTATTTFVERLKIWKSLPFNIRWNYRNINTNRFRSIMTTIGIIGCTVLLISGFGLYEQMNESKDWYFNDVNHFESKLTIDDDNINLSQTDSIAQKVDGLPIMESSVEILKNKTQLASLMVIDDSDLITQTDEHRNKIRIGDDEVSISQKMADMMNIKVGDTINCRLTGDSKIVKIKVDRIHTSPYSQGLVMSPRKFNKLGFNYTPTSITTAQHVNETIDGISISYRDDLIYAWNSMEDTSIMIISAMIFFAVVLALVILYNLNLLSFTEMEKDIGTLKVLGLKSRYLTKIFATQSLFFIIVGFLIGIPISYWVMSIVMPAFGKNFYLRPNISITNIILSFAIIVSTPIIMNLYFSRKIKDLDMVESLKSIDR